MRRFFEALAAARALHGGVARPRRWLYVAYDQLSGGLGPLSREPAHELGIVLVESRWKAARRPYHRQKLALVLANQRHFAVEQARRGVAVSYLVSDEPYRAALARAVSRHGPLRALAPAERELAVDLAPLVATGALTLEPHDGWLTTRDDFLRSQPKGPPWRLDAFHRFVRQKTGLLMSDDGSPLGGKYSFDAENRRAWRGEPSAAEPPRFEPDAVTREVGELIEREYAHHPGELDLPRLAATADDADRLWRWALDACLPCFGPFEDAMSERSTTLFHTRISAHLNLHRLLPRRVVDDVARLDGPLASREGFIRQVLGWREFVRHVHRETDGLRELPGQGRGPVADDPGDGGYARWKGKPWPRVAAPPDQDGGARPSSLGSARPVPPAYWGAPSGLRCLDRVVSDVWREGYSHHITRLMVLGNLGQLLELSPRELTDWFWVAYADAFDWVVEPNVLGMATYAVGGLFTTKPYVSGGAYIDKMSDYCSGCGLRRACPVTPLYWAFLARHRQALAGNPRLRVIQAAERRRSDAQRQADARVFDYASSRLAAGQILEARELERLLGGG